jgi:hypothetical protein
MLRLRALSRDSTVRPRCDSLTTRFEPVAPLEPVLNPRQPSPVPMSSARLFRNGCGWLTEPLNAGNSKLMRLFKRGKVQLDKKLQALYSLPVTGPTPRRVASTIMLEQELRQAFAALVLRWIRTSLEAYALADESAEEWRRFSRDVRRDLTYAIKVEQAGGMKDDGYDIIPPGRRAGRPRKNPLAGPPMKPTYWPPASRRGRPLGAKDLQKRRRPK